jgi:hypothetical protein
LRAIRYPKRLINSMSCDPDDTVVAVDHERHESALAACNFAIDQEILQRFVSAESQRLKAVAGPAASDRQISANAVRPDER